MKLFRALFIIDIGIAVILGLVFGVGLLGAVVNDHVDREDLLLWPPLIAGIGAVLGGAWWLKSRLMLRAANGVLLIMAVPGVAAGLFLLVMLAELSRPGALR